MSIVKAMQIENLKRQARRAHVKMQKISEGADCGNHMLRTISLTYSEAEEEFNLAVAQLQAIDPTFPKSKEIESATA